MTTQDLTVRRTDDRGLAIMELETRFAMAVRQRELLETYIKERLKPAKHFYQINDDPKAKPSLTKEGAELICLPHNLKPRYAIISGPENPPMDDSPYQMTVNCELMAGDKFGGQGLGSASSMNTKRDGTRIQRQKDPGLRHNATLKMACKSAYIAATLNATAASEFFTQDMDEEGAGDGQQQKEQGHWCTVHKTKFFKTAKMKSYAHPIGDTGQWCNEPSENQKAPIEAVKSPTESQTTAPAPEPTQAKADTKDGQATTSQSASTTSGSVAKKYKTDPTIIKGQTEFQKVCYTDFGLKNAREITQELNISAMSDIADYVEAYKTIAAARG